MDRLAGKSALITGAAAGIGRAIACRFLAEGAAVLANDIDADGLSRLKEETGVPTIVADVADPHAVADMFQQAANRLGGLDILVNNAGHGLEHGADAQHEFTMTALRQTAERAAGGPVTTHWNATARLTDEAWRRMIAVHLDGTFYCCREAVKIMTAPGASGSGCIINMSSILGTRGAAGAPHYCAAKAGILGLTRSLALELASRRIRVNAIAPGWVETNMTEALGPLKHVLQAQTPLGRLGDVDDIAHAAVYLASDEASFITGQTISPNGGAVM